MVLRDLPLDVRHGRLTKKEACQNKVTPLSFPFLFISSSCVAFGKNIVLPKIEAHQRPRGVRGFVGPVVIEGKCKNYEKVRSLPPDLLFAPPFSPKTREVAEGK